MHAKSIFDEIKHVFLMWIYCVLEESFSLPYTVIQSCDTLETLLTHLHISTLHRAVERFVSPKDGLIFPDIFIEDCSSSQNGFKDTC